MALIKCSECGNEVSTDAKTCPKCGAKVKVPKPKSRGTELGPKSTIAVLAVIGLILAIAFSDYSKMPSTPKDYSAPGYIKAGCRLAFENNANDPKSVEWLTGEGNIFFTKPDKTAVTVFLGVRAKNGFGALTKSTVQCDMVRPNTTTDWDITSMKEVN